MKIWIDVEDQNGIRYGDGPITTAVAWQSTARLDQAGTFSFQMPAADPRAALLANRRYVRCWSYDSELVEEGRGIIERIRVVPGDGPTMLEVSGDDILRELAVRTVGRLGLYEDVTIIPELWFNVVNVSNTRLTLPATIDLDPGVGYPVNRLIIKSPVPFDQLDLTLGSPVNTQEGDLIAQYWNEESGQPENVRITDGTAVGDKPLAQSGTISWSIPAGWGPVDGVYWFYLFDRDNDLAPVQITAATIPSREATSDALSKTMALAPPGWALDPIAGLLTTENENGVNLDMAGESVLATLGRIAEQTGEHFVRTETARRIRWLGSSASDSGLRAIGGHGVGGGAPGPDTMLILHVTETRDSYPVVTRLYGRGGGNGELSVTLAYASRTAPAGYTLNKTDSYLERSSDYGRIDGEVSYPDILSPTIGRQARIDASNALFDRMYERLRRISEVNRAYELTLLPSSYMVWPGQTIVVDYDEWIGSYHSVNIHATLWVLETTRQIDQDGVRTIGLKTATIDMWPASDAVEQARMARGLEIERAQTLAIETLTTAAPGVPYYVGIENGRIVQILTQTPVADGVYTDVTTLVIRNGLIAGIE